MKKSARKKKLPFWKKIQIEKKRKKLLKLGSLLLLVLGSVFLIKLAKSISYVLTTPLENKRCWAGNTHLGKTNRVNILLSNGSLLVFSLDKKGKEASVVLIPDDFYLETEDGVYRLGSFYELGEMRNGCGGRFLKKTVGEFLAIPLDRYIKTSNIKHQTSNIEEAKDLVKKIQSWRWFLGCLRKLRKSLVTDLSAVELLRLWWETKALRSDKIAIWDLEGKRSAVVHRLPDGTEVKTIEPKLLEEDISGFFEDSQVQDEGVKVEVLNTTGKQGLGNDVGVILDHLGVDLVHVGNWPEVLKETEIWLTKAQLRGSYTVQRLADIFKAKILVKPEVEEARGDLLILLGEDYSKRY